MTVYTTTKKLKPFNCLQNNKCEFYKAYCTLSDRSHDHLPLISVAAYEYFQPTPVFFYIKNNMWISVKILILITVIIDHTTDERRENNQS